jgi:PadR family transcriptional regulator PadR
MRRIDADTLYGTLSLLVLQTLREDRLHGLAIQARIREATGDALRIEEGALYPALHRLERDGLLAAEWGTSVKGRRAKFYSLTPRGKRRLARETENWLGHVRAVLRVLDRQADLSGVYSPAGGTGEAGPPPDSRSDSTAPPMPLRPSEPSPEGGV